MKTTVFVGPSAHVPSSPTVVAQAELSTLVASAGSSASAGTQLVKLARSIAPAARAPAVLRSRPRLGSDLRRV